MNHEPGRCPVAPPRLGYSVDNQRIVAVSNRRHSGLDAILFALLQEHPTNFRILILIFDERAAFPQAGRRTFAVVAGTCVMNRCGVFTAAKPERNVSCRLWSTVKVRVTPAVGRTVDTARFPIAFHHLVAFSVLKGTYA